MAHYDVSFDTTLVAFSYGISVLGSFTALLASRHMMSCEGATRLKWLITASVALGGGAIWSMHFIGMAAFDIHSPVHYSMLPTVVSALAAMVVPGVGLHIVSSTPTVAKGRLLVAGLFTGAGVVVMHYLGMSALHAHGHLEYNYGVVALSAVIAVVAATVALWLAINLKGAALMGAAAFVMGIAVCGMHYTGMAAAHISIDPAVHLGGETDPLYLALIVTGVAVVVLLPIIYVLLTSASTGPQTGRAPAPGLARSGGGRAS